MLLLFEKSVRINRISLGWTNDQIKESEDSIFRHSEIVLAKQ